MGGGRSKVGCVIEIRRRHTSEAAGRGDNKGSGVRGMSVLWRSVGAYGKPLSLIFFLQPSIPPLEYTIGWFKDSKIAFCGEEIRSYDPLSYRFSHLLNNLIIQSASGLKTAEMSLKYLQFS